MMCSKCKGGGEIIRNPCGTCKGVGVATISSREKINIPKGINTGQNLRIPGKGNQSESGGSGGDLIMKVNVTKDDYFEREGYDLFTKAYITISQVHYFL
jgi:molecular chaperone DnaJ